MSRRKKIDGISVQPPASTVPAVRAHRSLLEASLAELRVELPGALLASVEGRQGSKRRLSSLRRRIQDLEFEIDRNPDVVYLARENDVAVLRAWQASVQELPVEVAIEGLTKEGCATRCLRGVPGGCVIGGGCDETGSECWHPQQRRELFQSKEDPFKHGTLVRIFPFRYHDRASAVFDAAAEKLNIREKFV